MTTITRFKQAEQTTFNFIETHYIGLVTIFVLAFIAFGVSTFNHTLAGDEYGAIIEADYQNEISIRVGRWLTPTLRKAFSDGQPAASFAIFWLVTLQVIAAAVVANILKIKSRFTFFVLAAVCVFHPLWIESITFKYLQFHDAIGFLLACLYATLTQQALLNTLDRTYRLAILQALVGVICLMLATVIYQPYIFLGASVYLLSMIYHILVARSIQFNIRNVLMAVGVLIFTGIATLAVYAGSVSLALARTGLPPVPDDSTYSFTGRLISSPGELGTSLRMTGELLFQYFFRSQYGFPLVAKLVFLVFLAIYVIHGTRAHENSKARNARLIGSVLLILGTAAVFVIPWLLSIIRLESLNNFRYKALTPNTMIYAMLVAIVLERIKSSGYRVWLRLLSLLLIAIFVFQHNAAGYNVYQHNQHDRETASRLLMLVEAHENYSTLQDYDEITLINIGRPLLSGLDGIKPFRVSSFTLAPMNWTVNDCGVLDRCQIGRLPVLFELLHFTQADYVHTPYPSLDTRRQAVVDSVLAEMQPYPHPSSVQIIENNIVMMFEAPETSP